MISQAREENPSLELNKTNTYEEWAKKIWIDVISGNRIPANGVAIEFIAQKIVEGEIKVDIEEADVEPEVKFWEYAHIIYALGRYLSMNIVKQYMSKLWNFIQLLDMFYHENGYFLLKFHSFKDRDMVLMKGPYIIYNMSMILKEWSHDFDFNGDILRTLPIWVKLPHLPLHL